MTASFLDKSSSQAVITWNKDRSALFWSFSDEEWKELKASTQRAKLVIKFADRTTSSMHILGWAMIDLKTLSSFEETRVSRLQGKFSSSSEISFSIMLSNKHLTPSIPIQRETLSQTPRTLEDSTIESKAEIMIENISQEPNPPPQPISKQPPSFLTLTIQSAFNLHDPSPSNASYWISCCFIQPNSPQDKPPTILQTDKFSSLTNPSFSPASISYPSFNSTNSGPLHVFVCCDNKSFISRGVVSDIVDHIGHVVMVDLRHDVSTSESQLRMIFMNNVDANAGTVVIRARLDDVASSLPCIVPVSVRSAPIVHQQMIIQEEEEEEESQSIPESTPYWLSSEYHHNADISCSYRLRVEVVGLSKLAI